MTVTGQSSTITGARGLSLPLWMWEKIENDRGDVTRSKFIFRIIESYYKNKDNSSSNKKDSKK